MTAYLIFMALVTVLKHYMINMFSLIFIRLKYCLLVVCTVVMSTSVKFSRNF